MKLFFDVETTGLPTNFYASSFDTESWPRIVQLAYVLEDEDGYIIKEGNHIVEPDGFEIPESSTNIHGISQLDAMREGSPIKDVLSRFLEAADEADILIAHNMQFDLNVILAEFNRLGTEAEPLYTKKKVCTMKRATHYYSQFVEDEDYDKWPKLQELFHNLFGYYYDHEHDAEEDVKALIECYHELVKEKVIKVMDLEDHYEVLNPLYDMFAETRTINKAQLLYLLSKIRDLWLEIEFEHYANASELRNKCTFILGFLTALGHGNQITDSQQDVLFDRLYSLISLIYDTEENNVVVPYLEIENEDKRGYSEGGYFPGAENEVASLTKPQPVKSQETAPVAEEKDNGSSDDDLPF